MTAMLAPAKTRAPSVAGRVTQARVVRSEWTKLSALRSTWYCALVMVILLGTWGLTVVGTMFSALTVNLRLRELMLPTLVYPVMIPALMAAMELTRDLLNGTPLGGDNMIWVRLLIGFDIIFTALSVTLVDIVLVG